LSNALDEKREKKFGMKPKTIVTLHHQNIDQASKELNAIQAISSGRCFERSSIEQKNSINN
jgi:hypothetical protein